MILSFDVISLYMILVRVPVNILTFVCAIIYCVPLHITYALINKIRYGQWSVPVSDSNIYELITQTTLILLCKVVPSPEEIPTKQNNFNINKLLMLDVPNDLPFDLSDQNLGILLGGLHVEIDINCQKIITCCTKDNKDIMETYINKYGTKNVVESRN